MVNFGNYISIAEKNIQITNGTIVQLSIKTEENEQNPEIGSLVNIQNPQSIIKPARIMDTFNGQI